MIIDVKIILEIIMDRKKIIFITEFFPHEKSKFQTGGTISNRNFLRFISYKHDVQVISFDNNSELSNFCNEPYRVIQKGRPPWRALGLFRHWQDFVRQCTKDLVGGEFDVDFLIATTSTLAAFDVAPPKAKCLAIVQAFENFGLNCRWVPRRSRVDLAKGAVLRRFQDGRLIRRADGILTNSVFMRAAISCRFGIDPSLIHILKQQIDFKPAMHRPPQNTIGFVHRGPDKNIALILELARLAPDLNFLIYGHASDLPSSPPENVSLMGWASDRAAMFASAALWLVPSLWAEPFGRVSIEAQAAYRPVLVANRGGLPETVAHDRYVIDDFSPDAWLMRIRELLTIPESEIFSSAKTIQNEFSKEAHDIAIWEALQLISQSGRIH